MGRQSARRAAAVIAISESTRRDVIRLWQIDPDKVHTVYGGVDEQFRPLPAAEVAAFKQQQGLPDQFALFVGTIEPRKNVARLIEAYALWRSKAKAAPKLFIGGGKGWYYHEVFQLVEKLGLNDQVCFPGYIPQEDLALWYNAATMFVYPSLFEGFGLPVLEAMACGTPTITSCVSSLPEVAGEAARLVDPTDPEALSEAMRQVFSQVEVQQTMSQHGLRQSANFSWQKTAVETTRVYEHLLAKMNA
jgi:glycosyltransferase involved in cell wall biosynthesis